MMDRVCAARSGLALFAATLALSGCATHKTPPQLETITLPVPQNAEAAPPLPVLPITQSAGEDLWHLRSGLNVAALVCDPKVYTRLIPGYNRMLRDHKALLTDAARTEMDQFRVRGGEWQARFDTHMTKVYNQYSSTRQRGLFCAAASTIVGEADDLPSDQLVERATPMLDALDRAAAAH